MKTHRTGEQGITLVITLLVMTLLLVMGSAFMSISSTETLIAINERNRVQAFHAAEAGVERAIAELNANGAYTSSGGEPGDPLPPLPNPPVGKYSVTVCPPNCVPPATWCPRPHPPTAPADPNQQLITTCGAARKAVAQIEVSVQRGSPFQFGLFGINTFGLESSGTGVVVDSYDSSKGYYGKEIAPGIFNKGSAGDIHSNGNININLVGGNIIVSGNASAVGTIDPGATITGTTTQGVPSIGVPTNLSPPLCTGDVGISPGGSYVYDSGDCSLIVSAGKTVTFDQGTHSFGKITVESDAKIAVNGPVTLYLKDQFKAQKNTVINTSQIPGNLMIVSSSKGPLGDGKDAMWMTDLGPGESGEFYAGIYAPDGEVEFNNGGWQIFGAIVAKEIDIEDKSGFHYDVALANSPSAVGKFRPTAGTWREIFPQ